MDSPPRPWSRATAVQTRNFSTKAPARADHGLIAAFTPRGVRALDIGCGDGSLIDRLARERDVDGRGLELDLDDVRACVAKGLPVVQGDAERDLAFYPDDAFDVAILADTIQTTRHPREVLRQMLRIAPLAVVSFPNFAHWRARLGLVSTGRMPKTPTLPAEWWETRNLHLCTIRDFLALAAVEGAVVQSAGYASGGTTGLFDPAQPIARTFANWTAETGVFLMRRS
jgi:methionine biosynthesis protein MetW